MENDMKTKWEYIFKNVSIDGTDVVEAQKALNSMGQDGWEAVTWISDPRNPRVGWVLVKRPVRTPASVRGTSVSGI
jgi:hypothetical protein